MLANFELLNSCFSSVDILNQIRLRWIYDFKDFFSVDFGSAFFLVNTHTHTHTHIYIYIYIYIYI